MPRDRPPADAAPGPGFASRAAAAELLSAVLDQGRSLDALIDADSGEPLYTALPARDRALVRAIVGTALRRHGWQFNALTGIIIKGPEQSWRKM